MTYYCFNCGATNPPNIKATEDVASIMCDSCGKSYNVDDINGDLGFDR